jgi:predicted TIM-barrel fold metal-dependent hydrolase
VSEPDQRIVDAVEDIELVDTHEHIIDEDQRLASKLDLFYLFPHYASSDLVSAGMSPVILEKVRNPEIPLTERWELFEPYWKYVRTTAYGRALIIAARGLFGIHDINGETYIELSEKISQSNKPGWYRYVLRDESRIKVSLEVRESTEMDREFFAPVVNFDAFIIPTSRSELENIGERSGMGIHSLRDHEEALETYFEKQVATGMVGVKIGLAYGRTLRFDKVSTSAADDIFSRIFTGSSQGVSWDEAKPLQDHLVHRLIGLAIKHDLPIQIHTGIQEGNGNVIANSNPTLLTNLFLEYGEAKFDIFHGSYPYCSELSVLAKNFQNVFLDMCWLYVGSPAVSKRMLHEWIETVPSNKIMAFGGDYVVVEGTYAHSRMARKVVAEVLSEKVEEGYFSLEEAIGLSDDLLNLNAWNHFKLEERWKR